MIDYVSDKVKMLEPMNESQHQNIANKVELFSKLENVMVALQTRTETFKTQIQRDIDDRMSLAQEYDREKRAQMVESRAVADSIPAGYFSPDLQKQIQGNFYLSIIILETISNCLLNVLIFIF